MFKNVIISIGPLFAVLILFVLIGNFGISKVRDQRTQIDQATLEQNILLQKLNILRNISSTLGDAPNLATAALPSNNPALLGISQFKNLASTNGISLANIRAGTQITDSSGLLRVDISFDALGTREQITSFLKAISSSAPLSVVDTIKLNENSGASMATVTVKSFWSPLPSKLPAVTAALNDLTPDEKGVLTAISTLTQPMFLALPPAAGGGKTDPFSP